MINLKAKQLAHECPAWCLAWLPDPGQDIIFTGGADGTIKRWNISGTASKHADLFEDNDGDANMNGRENKLNDDTDIVFELTNTGKKSVGISPITDIKCVPVPGAPNNYLLSTVSVDSFVRVYAINTNNSKLYQPDQNKNKYVNDENSAGIDDYEKYDMNERHKVYLCDQNGKKSPAQYLEQYGGCWSSDINSDCSIIATGDQFGQIYLWSLYSEDEAKKIPTVVKSECYLFIVFLRCYWCILALINSYKHRFLWLSYI